MSDRSLKVLTTALLIFGLLLMLFWPAMIGHLPTHATAAARKYLLLRYTLYFTTLVTDFFATMVCAWVLLRRARIQALEESRENLRMLIEGTLNDHKSKSPDQS